MGMSLSLLKNVRNHNLEVFLNKESGIKKPSGELLFNWVNQLLEKNKIDTVALNDFLFSELMYGQRKYMHVYRFSKISRYKNVSILIKECLSKFGINSIDYNEILDTTPQNDDFKMVAIRCEYDYSEQIKKINCLFMKRIRVEEPGGDESSALSYLPLEMDLRNGLITVKVHNRRGIIGDKDTPKNQIINLIDKFTYETNIEKTIFRDNPNEVLYRMSKGLINDFFEKIPNIEKLYTFEPLIYSFIDALVNQGDFKNTIDVMFNGTCFKSIAPTIINMETELNMLIQQAIAFDFFADKNLDEILEQLSIILVSLKFNDRDNATASVSGENRKKAIFNSDTFMSLRKSMDIVKSISCITISYKKDRGIMKVKYDASDPLCLCIHIIGQRQYDSVDYKNIWEIYRKYEQNNAEDIGTIYAENAS